MIRFVNGDICSVMNGVIGQRRHRLNDESVDALVRSGAMLGSFKLYKNLKRKW